MQILCQLFSNFFYSSQFSWIFTGKCLLWKYLASVIWILCGTGENVIQSCGVGSLLEDEVKQVASVFFYCSFMVIHLAFSASGLSLQQVKQSQRRSWAIGCSESVGNCSHKLWFFLREFEPRNFFFLEIHLLKWIEDRMPPARYVQCLCRVIGLFNQTCEIVKF